MALPVGAGLSVKIRQPPDADHLVLTHWSKAAATPAVSLRIRSGLFQKLAALSEAKPLIELTPKRGEELHIEVPARGDGPVVWVSLSWWGRSEQDTSTWPQCVRRGRAAPSQQARGLPATA